MDTTAIPDSQSEESSGLGRGELLMTIVIVPVGLFLLFAFFTLALWCRRRKKREATHAYCKCGSISFDDYIFRT